MFKSGTSIFLGLVVSTLSLSAVANEKLADHTGWYVGGSIGHVDSEAKKARNFDSSGNAFGVYGGYNFSKWLGIEMDLQVSEDIKEDADLEDGSRVSSVYYGAFSVMPKLTWQINNSFALFGKAGMAVLSYTEETRRRSSSYRYRYDDQWAELVPGYALGAEVSTPMGVKIRLAYTSISGDLEYEDDYWDDVEEVDAKFETVTLGVHYQF
jgi:opacity protein-like surface antigen